MHRNPLDQVVQKQIGGMENGFLQYVDYSYDAAGKLLTINSPEDNPCLREGEICQLYWGNVESNIALEELNCGKLTSIVLDGESFELDPALLMSSVDSIEEFINRKIMEIGKLGEAEVLYQDYFGININFHLSIMGTNLESATLVFENCNYALSTKECCTALVVEPNGNFPISDSPEQPDLFFERIHYDGLDISMIEMIGACDGGLMRNHYDYDADHRLTEVRNELYNPFLIADAFSASYAYDPAGNITTINRRGWIASEDGFSEIDQLSFAYPSNSSILQTVTDASSKPEGFGKLSPTSEYTYDANGNLVNDSGKGLTIAYNLLNLPKSVSHDTDGVMTYEYSFGGAKIKKTAPNGARTYLEGIEYKDNILDIIHIPNGRIANLKGELHYQYYLTDHLGNVVVLFEDKNGDGKISLEEESSGADVEQEVLQRNFYYSFGMKMQGPWEELQPSTEQHYLYNGKENNPELGLEWLSFGFREYDPVIARFPSVDPIADNFAHVSSFNYAENTPIGSIDLWGLQEVKFNTTLHDAGKRNANMSEEERERSIEETKPLAIAGGSAMLAATGGFLGWLAGSAATATFFANEVKDEGLSYATNGWYDIFDLSKNFRNLVENGLKSPARAIQKGEDIPLVTNKQTRTAGQGKFKNVVQGKYGDDATKYIWTIDDKGLNIGLEQTTIGSNKAIKHTNLSPKAYSGGEVWFTSESTVHINAWSGRFGAGAKMTEGEWKASIAYWRSQGYNVKVEPYTPQK